MDWRCSECGAPLVRKKCDYCGARNKWDSVEKIEGVEVEEVEVSEEKVNKLQSGGNGIVLSFIVEFLIEGIVHLLGALVKGVLRLLGALVVGIFDNFDC